MLDTVGVLLIIGAVFFLIGILGGGIEISAIKMPKIEKIPRIIITAIGAIFMIIGIVRLEFPTSTPSTNNTPPAQVEGTGTAVGQIQVFAECQTSDHIPEPGGEHPPVGSLICIPAGKVAWISSDAAEFDISGVYKNTFGEGFTFTLYGPVRFTLSGVDDQLVRLDVRSEDSLLGNFDGKSINLVYKNGKICEFENFNNSTCP